MKRLTILPGSVYERGIGRDLEIRAAGQAHLRGFRAVSRQGPPDLAVEILSPGTRKTDEVVKRRVYERCGIHEYWIVDPELDLVKVYRLAGGKFERVAELSSESDDVLTTPLLPELRIPLRALFRNDDTGLRGGD